MAFEGEELGKPTDFLWVPFLAEQDDLAVPTYGIGSMMAVARLM